MTDRERELLRALAHFTDEAIAHPDWHRQWARPLDVGGRSGTHHGNTLRKLLRAELVEARVWRIGERRTFKYRISEAGRAALQAAKQGKTPR